MFSWFWQWKKLKIGQYLTKLRRTKQSVPVFVGHPVHVCTVSDYFRITSYNDKLVRGPMFCVAVYSAYKSCLWFGYSMSPKVNHYIITIKSYLTITPATGGGRGNLPQNGFAESDLIFSGIWELLHCGWISWLRSNWGYHYIYFRLFATGQKWTQGHHHHISILTAVRRSHAHVAVIHNYHEIKYN